MDDREDDHFDAFISYASVDYRKAHRIQHFLESWSDKRSKRRLKIYLDKTDIRGGSLGDELGRAARASRSLIVCFSPAAIESKWVAEEVRLFSGREDAGRMAAAIVGGKVNPKDTGRTLIPKSEYRVHDLRGSRLLGLIGLGIKIELLRLLAFIADIEMRELRNWHLRRTIMKVGSFAALALVPIWLLLNAPMDHWDRLDLKLGQERLAAIAAEVQGEKLLVATRFRGAGPQGFRDYIQIVDDALAVDPNITFRNIAMQRRLLPAEILPFDLQSQLPRVDFSDHTERSRGGPLYASKIDEKRVVLVQPLAPTEEEIEYATDNAADLGTPIPSVMGSLVVSVENGQKLVSIIPDFAPVWNIPYQPEGPTSPSRGLAIAWTPEGDLWLGMAGRNAQETGGLWHRSAGTNEWNRITGFSNVQSIEITVTDGQTRSIIVAEKHLERWAGIRLLTTPTRVVMKNSGETEWLPAPSPPYGSRSEVELVGNLDGSRLVRVDEAIFRNRKISLWRFLTLINGD